jgi:DeoR/GlpR family transcriptional regulator of sugar metabolism
LSALPDERQSCILDRLTRDGRVLAVDLAREFRTSEDTIRRDLRDLAAAGHCRRVYGGALPVSPASGTLAQRSATAPDAKHALARAAAALVRTGQVVLIDSGSTNLRIAEALPRDLGLTVVTNAPAVATALCGHPRCTVILLGGRVHPMIGAAFGPSALRHLDGIRADIAFLGACGLAPDAGLTVFDAEEASFKRRLTETSVRVVAALTTDKLGTAAPFGFASAARLDDLVIEASTPQSRLHGLDLAGLRLHRAAP